MGNPPVKVYKAGRIECAIFHNPQFDSYSFKFQKSYKDKQGQWQNTDFFSDTDMGDLAALCDHIREARVREKKKGGSTEEQTRQAFDGQYQKPTAQPPQQGPENFEDDLPF
jgi:hypothetical protein